MELKHFEFKFGKKIIPIPYYEIIGKKPGRMGFVAGGIRGDDVNSLNILRNFVRVAKLTELQDKISGVLLVFPALNLPAVSISSRFAMEDGLDLFQEFSSSQKNQTQALASELSHAFFKKCDFGITFLDSRSELDFLPNGKVYEREGHIVSDINELKCYGAKLYFKTKAKKKMMPIYLRDEFGTQVNVFEVGSKKKVSSEYVKPAMNGIRSVLACHKMLPESKKLRAKQIMISSKTYEKSKNTGLLNLKVELGKEIKKGDKLGIIFDPIKQKEFPIISTKDGWVYATRNTNLIQEGQALFYVVNRKPGKLVENRGFELI